MKIRQIVPDWLKGLAIVLMVYGHIYHVGSLAILQKQAVTLIYTFHIPVFLIISGFFFNTRFEIRDAVKKLTRRLILPYLIFISLYLIGIVLVQKAGIPTANLPPNSLMDFLRIEFLQPRGGYWFLHSLIILQLCFILGKLLGPWVRQDDPNFLSISIFLIAMACNFSLLSPRTATYFLLGIALNRFGGALPNSLKAGLLFMGTIILFAREEIFNFSVMQVAWCLSILAFLAGVARMIESSLVVSIFAWFGRNSLIVLVLHAVFIILLKPTSRFLLKLDQTGLIYSAIAVAVTMFGSLLVAVLLDKARLSIYLFGVNNIYATLDQGKRMLENV